MIHLVLGIFCLKLLEKITKIIGSLEKNDRKIIGSLEKKN